MTEKRFEGRIALVTGATRGIGRAICLQLAAEGAHVIAVGRTLGALEEIDDEVKAAGGFATLVKLDLRKGTDVDALGPSIYTRWGRLDLLVASAGVLGPLTPIGHVGDADWNEVMEVNLTSNWRLIRTLDPLLRKSDAARAMFLTSGAAWRPRAYWAPYAASKAGLEALVKSYAEEVANTPVRVNVANPGATRTAMRKKAFPGEDPMTLPPPEEQAGRIVDLLVVGNEETGRVYDLAKPRP